MTERIEATTKDASKHWVEGTVVGRYLVGAYDEPILGGPALNRYDTGNGFGWEPYCVVHIPTRVTVLASDDLQRCMAIADALSAHGPDIESASCGELTAAILGTRIPEWAATDMKTPYHHWLREQS